MANCAYRLLQTTTNTSIGAVATGALIPIGIPTRQIKRANSCTPTFEVAPSTNTSVYINEAGFYKINYQAYVTVAAAGNIVVQLQVNGVTAQTATVTASGAGTFLVSIVFMIRVLPNCNGNPSNLPVLIQFLNSGIALTGGTDNLIIERTSAN